MMSKRKRLRVFPVIENTQEQVSDGLSKRNVDQWDNDMQKEKACCLCFPSSVYYDGLRIGKWTEIVKLGLILGTIA